jgi:4-methylaminobutanoate oxidase (formaldehyde-forming)
VKLDKPDAFIGREALLRLQGQPLNKKLLTFVFESPDAYAWGGDAVTMDGQAVGELSSAGWSPKAGACVALGYVRGDAARRLHRGTPVVIDLYGTAARASAWDQWPPRPND